MTTATGMFMDTVSLNDDAGAVGQAPSQSSSDGGSGASAVLDVDSLEAQFNVTKQPKTAHFQSEENNAKPDQVVVVVGDGGDENSNSSSKSNGPESAHDVVKPRHQPVLPKLRVPPSNNDHLEERDYVDPSLFSPEVSRHAMEVAHRRAKAVAMEVKEMMELESDPAIAATTANNGRLSPGDAVGIIGSAFVSSMMRVKHIVKRDAKEYDLLAGSSPSSKMEDLDTDGDGLQISPDASKGDGKHFRSPSLRPALKRISAYVAIPTEKPQRQKKALQWHEDVLDGDEEFVDDGEEDLDENGGSSPRETNSLVMNGHSILNYKKGGDLTPRSKKKRKKLVKTMMRRLTPREKEELYRQRPDLMIVPNWAQKYREELAGEEHSRWSLWLVMFITMLAVLLIVLIFLIARQHAHATKQ